MRSVVWPVQFRSQAFSLEAALCDFAVVGIVSLADVAEAAKVAVRRMDKNRLKLATKQ